MAGRYDGSIIFDTKVDSSGFNAGTKGLSKGLSGVSGSLQNVALGIGSAFSVGAVVGFTKGVIESTAELEAMRSQFGQVFKGSEGEDALAALNDQAEDLGIHTDRLMGVYNKFGGQVKGAGMEASQALEATTKATSLAADAAAFYDTSMEDASANLASFMKGNFEAGDSIGVFTSAKQMDVRANEQYGKSWADLNESERQYLLLDTVSKTYEMNGAMGQAKRESDSWANVTGNLQATWKNFLEIVGKPTLSVATKVVKGLTTKLEALGKIIKAHPVLFKTIAIIIGILAAGILALNIAMGTAAIVMGLVTTAATVLGGVIAFLTSPIGLIILAIGAVIAIGYLLIKHWDEVKAFFAAVWEAIKVAFSSAIDNIVAIGSRIIEFFSGLPKKLFDCGVNLIKGLWDGIASKVTWIMDKIKGFASGITKKVKDVLGIHSPSRVFEGIGKNMALGMEAGLGTVALPSMAFERNTTIRHTFDDITIRGVNNKGEFVAAQTVVMDSFDFARAQRR